MTLDAQKLFTERFEADRGRLRDLAFRMLGSAAEADDAVQEAWLRLSRSDVEEVANLSAWLRTVVARICLDMLRSRKSRREEPLEAGHVEASQGTPDARAAEDELILAETVGLAMLVVLERLQPAERVAFVLHDMFGLPFDQIATVVGRSPAATRQLASRARRRVQGRAGSGEVDRARHQQVLKAFVAASRENDFEALLSILDPEVAFRADAKGVQLGGVPALRGAASVAGLFAGRAGGARPALIDGEPGLTVFRGEELLLALRVTFSKGRITGLVAIADRDALDRMAIVRDGG